MENSFNELKGRLVEEVRLYIPDYNKKFILETMHRIRVWVCLLEMDNQGRTVPIRYASKKLNKTERTYTITEKELLAVIWGIEYFVY